MSGKNIFKTSIIPTILYYPGLARCIVSSLLVISFFFLNCQYHNNNVYFPLGRHPFWAVCTKSNKQRNKIINPVMKKLQQVFIFKVIYLLYLPNTPLTNIFILHKSVSKQKPTPPSNNWCYCIVCVEETCTHKLQWSPKGLKNIIISITFFDKKSWCTTTLLQSLLLLLLLILVLF